MNNHGDPSSLAADIDAETAREWATCEHIWREHSIAELKESGVYADWQGWEKWLSSLPDDKGEFILDAIGDLYVQIDLYGIMCDVAKFAYEQGKKDGAK